MRCAGGTAGVLDCMVIKAPSTLGTFLRSFQWGHVRQLDRVSRELLARAWAAGAGPGDAPFTIDLDSTICETYGLAKEGARHHGYTGKRGYHPFLAVAAGTGDVLLARLREGRANTARGAAHFLLLDDLGYLPQGAEESEVLFTLIAERYERRSLGITSNLVFSQWEHIFANPMATAAAIDRVVHHSVILEFDVPSYRTGVAQKRGQEQEVNRQ